MKFESAGSRLYYYLGAAYYLYHWLFILAGSSVITGYFVRSNVFLLAGSGIVGVVALAGAIAAVIVKSKKRLDCLNPDLLITKSIDTYTVLPDDEYKYEKEISVKARHLGVERYKNKFKWSGDGQIDVTVDCSSQSCTATLVKTLDGNWDSVRVDFSYPMNVGNELSFKLTLRMSDKGKTAKPLFQKFIDDIYPNGLTMGAVWSDPPKELKREIFSSARAEIPLGREDVLEGQISKVTQWPIPRPRLGRRYRISWKL
jgi:hypothetical protein